ncbi:hypothetical protein Tcan_01670, partial [Toxocara canis]
MLLHNAPSLVRMQISSHNAPKLSSSSILQTRSRIHNTHLLHSLLQNNKVGGRNIHGINHSNPPPLLLSSPTVGRCLTKPSLQTLCFPVSADGEEEEGGDEEDEEQGEGEEDEPEEDEKDGKDADNVTPNSEMQSAEKQSSGSASSASITSVEKRSKRTTETAK